jgi:hypothetical protein
MLGERSDTPVQSMTLILTAHAPLTDSYRQAQPSISAKKQSEIEIRESQTPQ